MNLHPAPHQIEAVAELEQAVSGLGVGQDRLCIEAFAMIRDLDLEVILYGPHRYDSLERVPMLHDVEEQLAYHLEQQSAERLVQRGELVHRSELDMQAITVAHFLGK